MSTTNAFDDVLDDRTRGKADRGVRAARKAQLTAYAATYEALDAHGVDIPHRTFADPEDIRTYPTTVTLDGDDDTVHVHLHQDVQERTDDEAFGAFGAADDDVDDVTWTVVDLTDETVTITVVGEWSKRRDVPFETFPDEYEPVTVDVSGVDHAVPQFGY
jgi:hypothetical protein